MAPFTRRDFLKLASLLPLATLRAPQRLPGAHSGHTKNILILVFDAWTSKNIQIFGYPRETMPNLARIAERAIVYHNHHATSDFTTPGTASLLTGTLPWTHRALHVNGRVIRSRAEANIFNLFPGHYSIAYSHNVLVNTLLDQMLSNNALDEHVPFHEMMLYSDWVERIFEQDSDLASVSRYFALDSENALTNALFFPQLAESLEARALRGLRAQYDHLFPLGLPRSTRNTHYILETAREWLDANLSALPRPFLGYFHFLPPHDPYRPRADFVDRFDDGVEFIDKPQHILSENLPRRRVKAFRQRYDEFMAYTDDEFAKIFAAIEASGMLEDTILVLTSDHGEIFERQMAHHGTNTFHEPIIRVPLMIFSPDQAEGLNIHAPTTAVDVLPTLLHLSEEPLPNWVEGQVLPPFAAEDQGRSLFAVAAKNNSTAQPLTHYTGAIVRDGYKLTAYEGYAELPDGQPHYELYDVANDPEELENLAESRPGLVAELRDALLEAKGRADEPFT